jgi:uncharacterized protein
MDILNKPATATEPDVEMKIRGLMMDPVTNMPIIVLKDVNSDIVLPIWVGMYEANAIALEIEKSTPPRPMTHDLLRNAIRGLNAHVDKVVTMDARPSDALALALRSDCPIYVSRQVLDNSKLTTNGAQNVSADELRRWLEGLGDEDMGRYKM